MKNFMVSLSFMLLFTALFTSFGMAATVDGHAYKDGETDHSGITIDMNILATIPTLGGVGITLLLAGVTLVTLRKHHRVIPVLVVICLVSSMNCLI